MTTKRKPVAKAVAKPVAVKSTPEFHYGYYYVGKDLDSLFVVGQFSKTEDCTTSDAFKEMVEGENLVDCTVYLLVEDLDTGTLSGGRYFVENLGYKLTKKA